MFRYPEIFFGMRDSLRRTLKWLRGVAMLSSHSVGMFSLIRYLSIITNNGYGNIQFILLIGFLGNSHIYGVFGLGLCLKKCVVLSWFSAR